MDTRSILDRWSNLYRGNKMVGYDCGLLTILCNRENNKKNHKGDCYTAIYTSTMYDENNLEPIKQHVNACIETMTKEGFEINGWRLTKPDAERHPTILVYEEHY